MLAGQELPLKKPDIDNIVKVVADGRYFHACKIERTERQ